MGFSRNKMSIGMSERQRAIQADLNARSQQKGGNVNPEVLGAINTEEFSFAGSLGIPNEAVITAATKAGGNSVPGMGMKLNPEIEAIVAKAKNRLTSVAGMVPQQTTSDVFVTDPSQSAVPRIAMNKQAAKDELSTRKANLILKRNAKMKQMEWSQDKNLKVEVADMNREIKKIDSQLQGL